MDVDDFGIVMEKAKCSLAKWISIEAEITGNYLVTWAVEVAEGMTFLHEEANIIHRCLALLCLFARWIKRIF